MTPDNLSQQQGNIMHKLHMATGGDGKQRPPPTKETEKKSTKKK